MSEIRRKQSLGEKGEYLAKCYLENKGMIFVKANFRGKSGEIDLVMIDKDEIVFVEVKTRTINSAMTFGRGIEKIDNDKIHHIKKTSAEFLRTETRVSKGLIPRFDAVEVYIGDETEKVLVNHIVSAF